MLKVLQDKSTATCVVAECGGPMTAQEYEAWRDAVNEAISAATPGGACAVFVMTSSPMDADWSAFKADAGSFSVYQALDRVAYVGDVKWVDWVVDAFGWLTKAQEKTFEAGQLEEALAWAGASGE